MQKQLQIAFKNLPHSDALEAAIRNRASKLERFARGQIISCRVTVQEPNRRHQQGNAFVVLIDLRTPGASLTVGRVAGEGPERVAQNPYTAMNDAFDTMERRLKDQWAIRRHDVKTHALRKIA